MVTDDGGASFPFERAEVIKAADYLLDPASHDPFMLDRLGKLLRNQDKGWSAARANGAKAGRCFSNQRAPTVKS